MGGSIDWLPEVKVRQPVEVWVRSTSRPSQQTLPSKNRLRILFPSGIVGPVCAQQCDPYCRLLFAQCLHTAWFNCAEGLRQLYYTCGTRRAGCASSMLASWSGLCGTASSAGCITPPHCMSDVSSTLFTMATAINRKKEDNFTR